MLIRIKEVKKETCLCLTDVDGSKLVQCTNPKCTSPWWHVECAGLSSLSKEEIEKMEFLCALCTLSQKKFLGNFRSNEKMEEQIKRMSDVLEKTEKEMKQVQKSMKELNKLNECYQNDTNERKESFVKITKQLDDLKKEMKEDGKEEKSYAKALMKNIARIEEKQNSVVTEVAKEVVQEVAKEVVQETRISGYDRGKRERNIIIFGMKETDSEEDKKQVKELFEFIGVKEDGITYYRLGVKKQDKIRPVKVVFDEIDIKKKFLSQLFKLQKATGNIKSINIQHDLSPSERDHLSQLLKKAKEMNEKEQPKGFSYKVRGPPFAFQIMKISDKPKN